MDRPETCGRASCRVKVTGEPGDRCGCSVFENAADPSGVILAPVAAPSSTGHRDDEGGERADRCGDESGSSRGSGDAGHLTKRWMKSSEVLATSSHPLSIVSECPRFAMPVGRVGQHGGG